MVYRALFLLAFVVAACTPTTPTPSPVESATAAPSASVAPSVEPSVAPSEEPSVEPSVEPTVEPSPSESVEPSPEPVAIEFTGEGTAVTEEFELPASTYEVAMRAAAVNADSCFIDVTMVSTEGDVIEVGKVTSETGEATFEVAVPAGEYVLDVQDPSCEWEIEISTP